MIYIDSFSGIGDSVLARPVLKAIASREDTVYLRTPWPEFYEDIPNMRFVKPKFDYRTQTKNMNRLPESIWSDCPEDIKLNHKITISYSGEQMLHNNILQIYEKQIPLGDYPFSFDLPQYKNVDLSMIRNNGKPIAVIRPVSIRKEWIASARAPDPKYIYDLSVELHNAGYHIVSVADLEPHVEWIIGTEPIAHQKFHSGELTIKQLIQLIRSSEVAVGGVGWIAPVAMACETPTFIVFGGQGKYNQISKITDPRMNLTKIGYALPERFCKCTQATHGCPKQITNIEEKFWDFMRDVQLVKKLEKLERMNAGTTGRTKRK